MPAKARTDWDTIRAEYETGASQSALARKHGISRKAIQKHIEAESWNQDFSSSMKRQVAAKVAGVVAGCDPKKKAAAIDSEAERRAGVVLRHREEWRLVTDLQLQATGNAPGFQEPCFERAKLAKISAETLKIKQDGERKAWGLDQAEERVQGFTPLSPEELEAIRGLS
jgi:DNA-binding XRE family transcriptional regulator